MDWLQPVSARVGEMLAVLGAEGLDWVQRGLQVLALLVAGWWLARLASNGIRRVLARRVHAQALNVSRLAVYYGIFGLFGLLALQPLGIDVSVLVGAAGVLTVAVGFAAQTSASNVISGLFLLGERPFVIGDIIEVGGHTGEVVGIDLMSVKLRTFANLLIRVPNETLLKSEIKNLTHFPIRRVDLTLRVPFDTDVAVLRRVLGEVADRYSACLDEPAPTVWFETFGEYGMHVKLSAWAATDRYFEVANALHDRVLEAFSREGLTFAVPERARAQRTHQG